MKPNQLGDTSGRPGVQLKPDDVHPVACVGRDKWERAIAANLEADAPYR